MKWETSGRYRRSGLENPILLDPWIPWDVQMEWLWDFEEGIARSMEFQDTQSTAKNAYSQSAAENAYSQSAAENIILQSTDGDVGIRRKGIEENGIELKSVEENAIEEGNIESDGELQAAFGNILRFPTSRRPIQSKRSMDMASSDAEIAKWFTHDNGKQIQLGEQLTESEKLQGMWLLYTWRDRFCDDV